MPVLASPCGRPWLLPQFLFGLSDNGPSVSLISVAVFCAVD